jgi:hypothetical protein
MNGMTQPSRDYLNEMETFLKGIDLSKYRLKYAQIKLVEMDLPRDIQALKSIYEIYWNNKEFLDFDSYYAKYLLAHQVQIEAFRVKTSMCLDCFTRGLKARIYRTWASLITQIHAGYVAEKVFGDGTVEMSVELDHKKIDIKVNYQGCLINYQVKKESHRPEARVRIASKKINDGLNLDLFYFVPPRKIFEDPYKLDGTPRKDFERFTDNTQLSLLPNGFVVFNQQTFKEDKELIDSKLASE